MKIGIILRMTHFYAIAANTKSSLFVYDIMTMDAPITSHHNTTYTYIIFQDHFLILVKSVGIAII